MSEIHPNDIGLATFADVGDVNNLNTTAREIVAAINEVLAAGGGDNSGEQLLLEGENNAVFGNRNVICGDNNLVIGNDNVVNGDNHIIIGSKKNIATYPELSVDWYDAGSNRLYYYYYGENELQPLAVGTRVVLSLYQNWCDENWNDWVSVESEKVVTEITEFNTTNGYIMVAEMPELPAEPPDDIHTVLDYNYISTFIVLSDEYKVVGNGSVNMGYRSTGTNSFSANNGSASGNYGAAINTATSKDYCSFAANSSYAEGNYSFSANQGRTYKECGAALNYAYAYAAYSAALNSGRTAGRAIKCISMNCSSNYVTAMSGEVLTNLVGTKVLLRYNNPYNTIIYNIKTIASVSGQNIYFTESFGGSNYSLMPDGYIFRIESSYGHNLATGYGCAGDRYSQAHGNNTLSVHEGAVVNGRFGISPEIYSWSLANGTAYTNMGLAVKILQNGNIAADGTLSSPCADYAEYFEWEDGNPEAEDRAGYFVKLQGDKIVKCSEFDTPLGVISAMPAIIGDSGEMHWQGKYVTDDFGRVQYADVVIPAEIDENENVLVEEHIERQPVLNPDWDSSTEYIPRMKRPEWATVGVLGKLVVYDDGNLQSGDVCRVGEGGTAVRSVENGYPVLKRVSDDKVLIWVR